MRLMLLLLCAAACASCNSPQAARQAATEEYAVGSYEQSLEAYQLCAAQNADNSQKCSALARVIEADRKRYEKVTGAQ